MAELVTPDGDPVAAEAEEVNRDFARAMATDSPEPAAPPRRPPDGPQPPARRRGRPPKDQRARTGGGAATGPLSDADRAQGVKGVVQVGAGLCLLASRATAKPGKDGKRADNPAFKADAITLASAADELAGACVQTARADPKFAALIDKVAGVGPYGALITCAFGISAQLARNHKPTAHFPGTTDPAELIAQAGKQEQPGQVAA